MAAFLRLRQICLVATDLAHEAESMKAIFGLEECHRDPNVASYGLENVLFPVGTDFIEIVSPTKPGTAAGRFLERHDGRHGYMAILDCDDPESRRQHCIAMGVRIANVIRHGDYHGVQLHPRDTGGAMIEFNHTEHGEDPMGAYAPAGPDWQRSIRREVTQRLLAVEIEAQDPERLAARWGEVLHRPVAARKAGQFRIELDSGAINFLRGAGSDAALTGMELQVSDRGHVIRAAQARGCMGEDGMVDVCGVRFRLAGTA